MSISKKIFIISGSIFLILLFLWGIYKIVFEKDKAVSTPVTIEKTIETSVAPSEDSHFRLYAISDEMVLAPTLASNGADLKYYTQLNGNVYQVDLTGKNKKTISSQVLSGITSVLWSNDKSKVISNFSNNGSNYFTYFDYSEKKSFLLNKNIENVAWLNDNKIIYFYFDHTANVKNISIANPDGTEWRKVADVDFTRSFLAPIPQSGSISFWNLPDAFTETTLFSASITSDSQKQPLFSGKFGADYLWSPDGNSLLISHVLEKGGSKIQLALTNSNGGEYRSLDTPTFVSKCAWSKNSRYIFYALPGMIPENAVMPNDYFAKKFTTADTFWKLDITNGKKTRLLELSDLKGLSAIDAINLFLSEDETALFFTNRNDGRLYRLDL